MREDIILKAMKQSRVEFDHVYEQFERQEKINVYLAAANLAIVISLFFIL
jgi:metal-dependent HD superfamily phosphatase/phosphodiesterase